VRVLLVNKFPRVTGGADRHCLDLARGLQDAGHHVALLSTNGGHELDLPALLVKSTVDRNTRAQLRRRDEAKVAARALWNRAAAAGMSAAIDAFRPDVVHCHKLYPQLSSSPMVIARRHGLRVVQTLHDYEFLSADLTDHLGRVHDASPSVPLSDRLLNDVLLQLKRRVATRCVDAWIAPSQAVARWYGERMGIRAEVIEHFAGSGPAASQPRSFAERSGVLFLGRLSVEKGVRDVMALARRLPNVAVRVAGAGPLAAEVRATAARLPNLTYLGQLNQAAALATLELSRVCVLPSRWEEPAGLACLEAMQCGTPVVAYRVGGLQEYARTGRVVDCHVEALANACEELAGHPSQWAVCSQSGLDAVRWRYGKDRYIERITPILEGTPR
jgi:glycosyltransferase involved in cell wall biosynthesis